MANVHPIVSAMQQIKGDKPKHKVRRAVICLERLAIGDVQLNKKTVKKILKLTA